MTITSLLLMVTFLDFGVGNGLVAPIAEAIAKNRLNDARRLASRGIMLTAAIGVLMGGIVVIICSAIPLDGLFPGVDASVLDEARTSLLLFGTLIGLTPALGGIGRILAGMQRAYITHVANAVGSVATMILLFAVGGQGLSISGYILITFGMVQVASFAPAVLLWRERWLAPAWLSGANWEDYRSLLATGGLFLGIQVTMVASVGLDQTLISVVVGPASVAGYAITQRLFMLVAQPLYIFNAPLWAAYADALHRHDYMGVRKMLVRSLAVTALVAILGGTLLIALGPLLWGLVTGDVLTYSATLMVTFALWTLVESLSNAWGMYLNAAHFLREQCVTMIMVALICISAKVFVLQSDLIWGVPLIGALSYGIIQLIYYAGFFRKRLGRPFSPNKQADHQAIDS